MMKVLTLRYFVGTLVALYSLSQVLSFQLTTKSKTILQGQSLARQKTCLFSKKNETDSSAEIFLSEMAKNMGEDYSDLMAPPLLPQDTYSKMKRWAGEYDKEGLRAKLNDRIQKSPIFLLMFGTCPYCINVMSILQSKNVSRQDALIVNLDSLGLEKYAIRTEVIEMINQTTIPALWIGGEFIGGFEELSKLANSTSGELDKILKRAGGLS